MDFVDMRSALDAQYITPVVDQGSKLTTLFSHDSEYFEVIHDGNGLLSKKRRLTYKQKPPQPYGTCDDV